MQLVDLYQEEQGLDWIWVEFVLMGLL
jgi:hypothetical protein